MGEAGSFEVPRSPTEGRGRLASSGRVRAAGTEGVGPPKPRPTGSMAGLTRRSQASAPRPAGKVRLRGQMRWVGGLSFTIQALRPLTSPCFPPPPTRLLPPAGRLASAAALWGCFVNWKLGVRVEIDDLKGPPQPPFYDRLDNTHALSPPPSQSIAIYEFILQGSRHLLVAGRGWRRGKARAH